MHNLVGKQITHKLQRIPHRSYGKGEIQSVYVDEEDNGNFTIEFPTIGKKHFR